MTLLRSSKRYGHGEGLSCCFRQWRATSHCRLVHGYALAFRFTFEGEADERGWVMDFGGLGPLRAWLRATFDHTLLVAADDPEREALEALSTRGLARVVVVERTGCEAVAAMALSKASEVVAEATGGRVRAVLAEVWEHEGNMASCAA